MVAAVMDHDLGNARILPSEQPRADCLGCGVPMGVIWHYIEADDAVSARCPQIDYARVWRRDPSKWRYTRRRVPCRWLKHEVVSSTRSLVCGVYEHVEISGVVP